MQRHRSQALGLRLAKDEVHRIRGQTPDYRRFVVTCDLSHVYIKGRRGPRIGHPISNLIAIEISIASRSGLIRAWHITSTCIHVILHRDSVSSNSTVSRFWNFENKELVVPEQKFDFLK